MSQEIRLFNRKYLTGNNMINKKLIDYTIIYAPMIMEHLLLTFQQLKDVMRGEKPMKKLVQS